MMKKFRAHSPKGEQHRKTSPTSTARSKSQHDMLVKERAIWEEKMEALKSERELLQEKFDIIVKKVVDQVDSEYFDIDDDTDLSAIGVEDVIRMISRLSAGQTRSTGTIEGRVEELESRVTHQSQQVASMVLQTMKTESCLEAITQAANLQEAKVQARKLQRDLSDARMQVTSVEEPYDRRCSRDVSMLKSSPLTNNSLSTPVSSKCNLVSVRLSPPFKKGPGETHISKMDRDLRLYLVQELSLYKSNGMDWRCIADRVGISDDVIQQWIEMRLDQPMTEVLRVWGQSSNATVRIFHRHLKSPQMRSILPAKRIADFYMVD